MPCGQVSRKCMDVHGLINAQTSPPWRHYAMLMFANKVSVCLLAGAS